MQGVIFHDKMVQSRQVKKTDYKFFPIPFLEAIPVKGQFPDLFSVFRLKYIFTHQRIKRRRRFWKNENHILKCKNGITIDVNQSDQFRQRWVFGRIG